MTITHLQSRLPHLLGQTFVADAYLAAPFRIIGYNLHRSTITLTVLERSFTFTSSIDDFLSLLRRGRVAAEGTRYDHLSNAHRILHLLNLVPKEPHAS